MRDRARGAGPLAAHGSHRLLQRILDDPRLVDAIHALEPRALGALIRHVGLEDAGEIVSLATTEQLAAVFDDDLWRSAGPGVDETFDAARFALWLEVMVEAGEEFAARRLAELDEDLVSLALHRQILVIDIDELAVDMAERGDDDDAAMLEKALESCPYEELGPYRVIARQHQGWDAIVSLLLALDRDHRGFLERLLERLAYLSRDSIDDGGGLYQVLTAEATLEADAAADREERRSREGYVAPSDAASFLALARDGGGGHAAEDPITRAYFRDLAPAVRAAGRAPTEPAASRLVQVLRESGVVEAGGGPALLTGEERRGADSLFRDALAELAGRDPSLHEQRLRELHYLANVLVAGSSLDGRRFRPSEAAAAVIATCNLGLQRLGERAGQASAVALFRTGWRVLHDEVSVPARRAAASIAAALDPAAGRALRGLTGDCPHLTGHLARPGAAREARGFFATDAEVQTARAFLAAATSAPL